jgi:hypothetical protein
MKLINWSRVPKGTATNYGELVSIDSADKAQLLVCGEDRFELRTLKPSVLRIIPQMRWTYHDGTNQFPVPDGLIVEVMCRGGLKDSCPVLDLDADEWWHRNDDSDIIAFRITGVDRAGGWTDDPTEVSK